ncbi:MAG: hypothetical protein JSS72_03675 [Armatimonadetes bacterium]|nr:hypothetical protein [Armatimonadota bacterium]
MLFLLAILCMASSEVHPHSFAVTNASYDASVTAQPSQDVVVVKGVVTHKNFGTKDGKPYVKMSLTNVTFKQGKAAAAPKKSAVREYKIDPHGIPYESHASGREELLVISSSAGYLPDGTVELDKEFPVKWSSGETSIDGTGVAVMEKDRVVVKIKGTYVSGGTYKYHSECYYDKAGNVEAQDILMDDGSMPLTFKVRRKH